MYASNLFSDKLYPVHLYPRLISPIIPIIESLTQTLFVTQGLALDHTKINQSILPFLTITQTVHVELLGILTRSITDTVPIYDFIVFIELDEGVNPPPQHVADLTSNLVFTQTLSVKGKYNKSIHDVLTFSQIITFPYRQYLSQNLIFTQTVSLKHIYKFTLTDHIFLTQIETGSAYKFKSLLQTLFFTQSVSAKKQKVRKLIDTLFFTQVFIYDKYLNFNFKDTLNFKQTIKANTRLTYFIADVLLFKGGGGYSSTAPNASKIVDNTQFIYQDVVAVKIHRYVILKGNSTIILPAPLFGDSRTNISSMNIQRMVKGNIRTYIKTTQRQKLNYKFYLKRQKAYELQRFIDDNDLLWLDLENWKGEAWKVRITNNPIVFEATEGRFVCPDNREIHEVDLQFEGILLSASASSC